jgi:hypothetical protein
MVVPQRILWLVCPVVLFACLTVAPLDTLVPALRAGSDEDEEHRSRFLSGTRLFERETFGGNGRTCRTCHSRETGTVAPEDAQDRFAADPNDPLFRGDGSDDGKGNGVTRLLADATIRITVPLHENVSLAHDPNARSVVVPRGIPTTLNTPALDPVLMYDGRHPTCSPRRLLPPSTTRNPHGCRSPKSWRRSSHSSGRAASSARRDSGGWLGPDMRLRYHSVGPRRSSADGRSSRTCRLGPATASRASAPPVTAARCSTRRTSSFQRRRSAAAVDSRASWSRSSTPPGTRSTTSSSRTPMAPRQRSRARIRVAPSSPGMRMIASRALTRSRFRRSGGVARTAPYFHDNSAKTLEDVLRHSARFFAVVTDPAIDGDPAIDLTEQDQQDIIAFMKLLR